jgi:hypothetical protein
VVISSLFVFVPFDLGLPLKLPPGSGTALNQFNIGRVATADAHLAKLWKDDGIRQLFGAERIVAIRSDAAEFADMTLELENTTFPWGTNALLGRALRIWSDAGSLMDTWKQEALLIPESSLGGEITERSDDLYNLQVFKNCQICVDAFECGIACLRLRIPLDGLRITFVEDIAAMLEYAIYGDARKSTGQEVSASQGEKIGETNERLRSLGQAIVRHFRDKEASPALDRRESLIKRRAKGILLRWTTNVIVGPIDLQSLPEIESYIASRQERSVRLEFLSDIKSTELRFVDDSWMALAFVIDDATMFRLLYVLTVAETAAQLAISIAQDVDLQLLSLMTNSTPARHRAADLRDVRTFAQIAVGLTDVWRISAYDVDIAVIEARAKLCRLAGYRQHVSDSSETLYSLESASHAERTQSRTDAFVAVASIVSLVTIWGLILALKDWADAALELKKHVVFLPTSVAHHLYDLILLTLALAIGCVVWLFLRVFWLEKRRSGRSMFRRR